MFCRQNNELFHRKQGLLSGSGGSAVCKSLGNLYQRKRAWGKLGVSLPGFCARNLGQATHFLSSQESVSHTPPCATLGAMWVCLCLRILPTQMVVCLLISLHNQQQRNHNPLQKLQPPFILRGQKRIKGCHLGCLRYGGMIFFGRFHGRRLLQPEARKERVPSRGAWG